MEISVIRWIYKMVTIYLSLWIPVQTDGQTLHQSNHQQTTKFNMLCMSNFTYSVQKCLDQVLIITRRLDFTLYGNNRNIIYFTIYKQYYCRQYEASLQCLHERLSNCETDYTTSIVQSRLSQPWALATNKLCDINVKTQTLEQDPLSYENNFMKGIGTVPDKKMQEKIKQIAKATTEQDLVKNQDFKPLEHQTDDNVEIETNNEDRDKTNNLPDNQKEQTINIDKVNDSDDMMGLTNSNKSNTSKILINEKLETKTDKKNISINKEKLGDSKPDNQFEITINSLQQDGDDNTAVRFFWKALLKKDLHTNVRQIERDSKPLVSEFEILQKENVPEKIQIDHRWKTRIGKMLFKHN